MGFLQKINFFAFVVLPQSSLIFCVRQLVCFTNSRVGDIGRGHKFCALCYRPTTLNDYIIITTFYYIIIILYFWIKVKCF
jgi:hypothetical protein